MPTWGAVGLGAAQADVEETEVRNLYDETAGLPPKAPYRVAVKQLRVAETGPNSQEPGTPMVKVISEISHPAGTAKRRYNGFPFFTNIVVTEANAGRINQLLKALMGDTSMTAAKQKAVLTAWHTGKVVYEKDTNKITKIGAWVLPDTIMVGVTTRKGKWNGDDTLEVGDFMSIKNAPADKAAEEEPEEDLDETEEAPEEDDDVTAREEELSGYTLAKLKITAKGLSAKLAEYKDLEKDDLVNFILDLEFPPEEEEDEDEEEENEEEEEEAEEEGDDLDGLSRVELKKINTSEGLGIKVTTKMSDDDLREAIREARGDEAEEEEPDEEDEPPAKPVRRGAAAKAAPKGRAAATRRSGKDGDAPF